MRREEQSSRSSDVRCVLCSRADETGITGALSCKQGTAAHQNCLLYASGIYCKNSPTYDDLFGFEVEDVEKERRRGRKLKCHYCNKNGATAGCEVKSCKRSYHYPCSHEAQARSEDVGSTFRLYCAKHNPHDRNAGSEKHGDGKERNAKVVSSNSDCKSSKTNEQDNSPGESESDSETPRRPQSNKRRYPLLEMSSSDSDETQSIIDLEMAPLESEFEDNTPPNKNTQPTLDSGHRSKNYKKHRKGVAFADDEGYRDSDFESQSLLQAEYRQENVPFTVIADSGPSVESVAENSSDSFSYAAPSPAGKSSSNVDQSACASAALDSNITVPPNPHVPARPSLDSPQCGTTGESCRVKEALCVDLPLKMKHRASLDVPSSFQDEPAGSHVKHPRDHPLDLTSPGGWCMVQTQCGEPVGHVGVLDLAAARFWERCNEMGCTEAIFTELTHQLSSLAGRVKNRHATQEDYAVSLRILEASGRLPAIFEQMEQEFEAQEKQLQRKRQALRDARAVLDESQC